MSDLDRALDWNDPMPLPERVRHMERAARKWRIAQEWQDWELTYTNDDDGVHLVAPGDSARGIALGFGVTVGDLLDRLTQNLGGRES